MQTFGRTGVTSFLTRKEPGTEDAGVVEDDIKKVSHYFINTLHHNTGYFLMVNVILLHSIKIIKYVCKTFQFVFCEFLNMFVIVLNIYLTDFFLEGRFMK